MSVADQSRIAFAGESSKRVGKSLIYAAMGDNPVFRDDTQTGAWKNLKDIGERDVEVRSHARYTPHVISDLQSRYELRRQLSGNPNAFLVTGVLADGVEPGLWQRRNKTLLKDAPRHWLTLDIDGLEFPNTDVVEQDGELPDLLFEALDRADLGWLISDCLIHLSSRHGLLNRNQMRAHVEWWLDEPLTLEQQKSVAGYINSKSRLVDTIIYQPACVLFTGPARLFKRTYTDRGVVETELPQLPIQRVRMVNKGCPQLKIPGEALKASVQAQKIKAVRTLVRATGGKTVPLEPGNVYAYVRASVMAKALGTPAHRSERAKAELREKLEQRIAAMTDSDDLKLSQRLAYVTPQEIERSWSGALQARYRWTETAQTATPRRLNPAADARLALTTLLQREVADAVLSASFPNGEKPRHTLIKAPPGIGKTHAALASIQPEHLTTHRIDYFAPTLELSAEIATRFTASLPADPYIRSRIRHHKGRKHLCKEPEYDLLCKDVEALGRSPLQPVCGMCPRRDACPWPAQQADHESGLVARQHAHITSSMARTKAETEGAPTLCVIDESLLDTLLSKQHAARRISTVRRLNARTSLKANYATADVQGFRVHILDILHKSDRFLRTSSVTGLKETVSYGPQDDRQIARKIDAMLDAEAQTARHYAKTLHTALKDHHDARASGKPTHKSRRAIQKASRHIMLSDWFRDLYTAIKATLDIPERDHVFGVRITNGTVSVHIRQSLSPLFSQRNMVWLDGTADEEVWRAMFGPTQHQVELRAVDMPIQPGNYHLTQYPDRIYSKAQMSRPDNVDQLYRLAHYKAAQHAPKQVLLICQLEIEKKLRQRPLPTNLALHHFNAIRGLDSLKDASCAIIIGRPLPPSNILEAQTEALYYDDPAATQVLSSHGRMQMETRQIATVNGVVTGVQREVHPDIRVEALRRQRVDMEVRQAIHRMRLYDRGPDNPAELHVFGQVDTGLPVHRLMDWVDADFSTAEIVGASGIYPISEKLARRASRGLLSLSGIATIRRVVEHNTNKYHHAYCKNIRERQGVLIKAGDTYSSCSCNETKLFAVRVPGFDGYPCRVRVQQSRWPDARAAIEWFCDVSLSEIRQVDDDLPIGHS